MNSSRPSALILSLPLGLLLALASPPPAEAQRAATGPPDWPCVQRLVPELAWGTIWTGPSLDEVEEAWYDDEEVGRVVRYAMARETRSDDAMQRVSEFVDSLAADDPAEREARLTLLFSGLFELTQRERSRTIERIRGASRAQVARLEKVAEMVDELEALRGEDDMDLQQEEELSKALFWEQRTFQTRQQSLPALCEQPYLLEERLGQMVRIIDAGM
ncbi:hypothetical protein SAMN05192555_11110 [Franzmannia pantelleriensis]|uniref:Uncharacterized protein n=1 Tax=Franzmannia pantelleriensis TaxID=48727 RepID=A0A1G9RRK1_9GAMM|nr:hypothetical protein [Halomonas pantelleriensis]SDM25784.1 hypothetical protein SAMN05192555_11110 [Halomonas pantelleriensis]